MRAQYLNHGNDWGDWAKHQIVTTCNRTFTFVNFGYITRNKWLHLVTNCYIYDP